MQYQVILTNLGAEKAVALLFHIVVDDSWHLFLPDLQSIDVDIVLDVLKWPPEAVHHRCELFQLRHQFTRLSRRYFNCQFSESVTYLVSITLHCSVELVRLEDWLVHEEANRNLHWEINNVWRIYKGRISRILQKLTSSINLPFREVPCIKLTKFSQWQYDEYLGTTRTCVIIIPFVSATVSGMSDWLVSSTSIIS